jgi:hypothetical protein
LRDDETNARVAAALEPRVVVNEDYLRLQWNDTSSAPRWNDIDFGIFFDAELRVGERVVGTSLGHVDWGRAVWKDWEDAPVEWVEGGREAFERAMAEPGTGEPMIVLRGDPRAAAEEYLRNPFTKPRAGCWAGEVVVPARQATQGPPGGVRSGQTTTGR